MASSNSTPSPQGPRPGQSSHPSGGGSMTDLPLPEELQELLGGAYIVEGFLGQGGMGAVYKGLQMPLRRPVAIKILARGQHADNHDFGFEERFKREAYAMAALTHPNIVHVYDCGDAGDSFLFISMELVEGGDLSDAIKQGRMEMATALKLIPEICDGIIAAHERGIVHRDIKPANIFITGDGRAKVADFGLAKRFDADASLVTKTGLGMGTPDYAAPEQYEGVSDIDHRADIFALGVMIYQMITGRLPRGATYRPASQVAAVDPRFDPLIESCLAPDREERCNDVSIIKQAVLEIATPTAGTRIRPASATSAVPMPTTAAAVRPASGPRHATPTRPVPAARPAVPTSSVAISAPAASSQPGRKPSNATMLGGVALSAIALVAALMFLLRKPPSSTSPRDAESGGESAAVVRPSPVPAPKLERVPALPVGLSNPNLAFPPGEWVKVFATTDTLPPVARAAGSPWRFEDGWLSRINGRDRLFIIPATVRNVAIRYTAKDLVTSINASGPQLREKPGSYCYKFVFRTPTEAVLTRYTKNHLKAQADDSKRETYEEGGGTNAVLHRHRLKVPLGSTPETTIEFAAVGDRLLSRVNEEEWLSSTDHVWKEGSLSLYVQTPVTNIEATLLDGLDEAEALRRIGVPSP